MNYDYKNILQTLQQQASNSPNINVPVQSAYSPPLLNVQNNEGKICFVDSFDDIKHKQIGPNEQRCYWQKPDQNKNDVCCVYLVITNENGERNIGTYSLNKIPNPVPITQDDAEKLENRILDKVDNKIGQIEQHVGHMEQNIGQIYEAITKLLNNNNVQQPVQTDKRKENKNG